MLIVEKPHKCAILAERVERAEQQSENAPKYGGSIIWNCSGSTRSFKGGPGTGMPRMENDVFANPGHREPTLASLGLTEEHGKKLGIK